MEPESNGFKAKAKISILVLPSSAHLQNPPHLKGSQGALRAMYPLHEGSEPGADPGESSWLLRSKLSLQLSFSSDTHHFIGNSTVVQEKIAPPSLASESENIGGKQTVNCNEEKPELHVELLWVDYTCRVSVLLYFCKKKITSDYTLCRKLILNLFSNLFSYFFPSHPLYFFYKVQIRSIERPTVESGTDWNCSE